PRCSQEGWFRYHHNAIPSNIIHLLVFYRSYDVRCVKSYYIIRHCDIQMEDVPSFVFDFFVERHIILKEEWLSNVLIFLFSFFEADIGESAPENPKNIASLVYEQWKYTDISESTYPLLKQLAIDGNTHRACVNQPLILQIASVVDIGASFYSQFCALVHEFVDNTGFEPLPDMEHGPGLENLEAKPRRMLSFTVSDGETILRAIEYHSIKSFSLLTKPGCKILLIPPILCRKGVFFLKPTNVQLLGGDVESFFTSCRPLQVMSERLNLPIPTSKKQSLKTQAQAFGSEGDAESVVKGKKRNRAGDSAASKTTLQYDIVRRVENNFRTMDEVVKRNVNVRKPTEVFNKIPTLCYGGYDGLREDSSVTSGSSHTSGCALRASWKPVAQVSPMHTTEGNSRGVQNRLLPIPVEDSPPDFDAELNRLQTTTSCSSPHDVSHTDSNHRKRSMDRRAERTSIISLCSSQLDTSGIKETPRIIPRRPATLGIRNYLGPSSPCAQKQSSAIEIKQDTPFKKVKIEVIELDDEEDVKPNKLDFSTISSSIGSPACTEPLRIVQNPNENDIVTKFQALNVVYIGEALKQMRFAVGSCRKTIQGIVVDIVNPLRIVDDLWTMKVTIQDVSFDNFTCIIDNSTLSSLIGLTPKEAIEIRASSDMNRRQDAQRRLAAVEEQLRRLDLLLDVELFSGARADPIIRNIRTLMQALDVL
ncbi:hypothetical protein Angca_008681, partial [Angiostrongylus cantonensis]